MVLVYNQSMPIHVLEYSKKSKSHNQVVGKARTFIMEDQGEVALHSYYNFLWNYSKKMLYVLWP